MIDTGRGASFEEITIHFRVDNNSGRAVQSIKLKLKQTWSFGGGYFEKFTIFKVKHKDERFPLGQEEYENTLTTVIPEGDLRPSIQNACLIRCSYHITLIASVRAAGALRVRIPIIVASYPPKRINSNDVSSTSSATIASLPDDTSRNAQHSQLLETKMNKGTCLSSGLVDWDASLPEQVTQLDIPLVPSSSVDNTNVSALPPQTLNEPVLDLSDYTANNNNSRSYFEEDIKPPVVNVQLVDQYISGIGSTIQELESIYQRASTGNLVEVSHRLPVRSYISCNDNIGTPILFLANWLVLLL